MPSYGSLHSPSLRKMNGQMGMDSRRASRRSMSMDNIIGDPFALATISISVLAWLIAFVGSAIATTQPVPEGGRAYPNYSWFGIAYMLCLIVGIFIVVASDTTQTYHVAIVGFLSAGLILTSSGVNDLIYTSNGAKEAAAAGFILLSMVNIVWIFYFGSTPSAVPRAYLDSFALHKEQRMSNGGRGMSSNYGNGRPNTSPSSPPQMYTSAQLGGFETSSPVAGFSSNDRGSTQQQKFGNITTPTSAGLGSTEPPVGEVVAPTEYPYKARAIYSYEANPDDANEISFAKHEVLEVSDVSGRWWQAKKESGQTGIAPSNYLLLL